MNDQIKEIEKESKASSELIRAVLEKHLVDYLPISIRQAERELERSISESVSLLLKSANERERKRTRHIFITMAITFALTIGGIGFLLGRVKGFI